MTIFEQKDNRHELMGAISGDSIRIRDRDWPILPISSANPHLSVLHPMTQFHLDSKRTHCLQQSTPNWFTGSLQISQDLRSMSRDLSSTPIHLHNVRDNPVDIGIVDWQANKARLITQTPSTVIPLQFSWTTLVFSTPCRHCQIESLAPDAIYFGSIQISGGCFRTFPLSIGRFIHWQCGKDNCLLHGTGRRARYY
jgi:hypothetical protein